MVSTTLLPALQVFHQEALASVLGQGGDAAGKGMISLGHFLVHLNGVVESHIGVGGGAPHPGLLDIGLPGLLGGTAPGFVVVHPLEVVLVAVAFGVAGLHVCQVFFPSIGIGGFGAHHIAHVGLVGGEIGFVIEAAVGPGAAGLFKGGIGPGIGHGVIAVFAEQVGIAIGYQHKIFAAVRRFGIAFQQLLGGQQTGVHIGAPRLLVGEYFLDGVIFGFQVHPAGGMADAVELHDAHVHLGARAAHLFFQGGQQPQGGILGVGKR